MNRIHIRQLTKRFISRESAIEAFNNLVVLEKAPKVIELDNVLLFSYPFLDEFISRISKDDKLKEITFQTDDELTLDKLAYIVGTRHIDIAVSGTMFNRHHIQPKIFTRHKAVFIDNKDKPDKEPDQEQEPS